LVISGFETLVKGLFQPQPRQAAGFDTLVKGYSNRNRGKPLVLIPWTKALNPRPCGPPPSKEGGFARLAPFFRRGWPAGPGVGLFTHNKKQ